MKSEDLIVVYKGKPISALNEKLVESQHLSEERVEILKALHIEMYELKEKIDKTDDKNELRELVISVENLEFMMQDAWGFEKNRNYHTHWFDCPKCTCPRMDNYDNVGTPFRVINEKCLLHGKIIKS